MVAEDSQPASSHVEWIDSHVERIDTRVEG